MAIERFTKENLPRLYRKVASGDAVLQGIIDRYGLPPLWVRPNSFQTLVLTILEQQVSLASAFAAYKRLVTRLGTITPAALLSLTEEELRACYLSRQKISYTRGLAEALLQKRISLRKLQGAEDETVRHTLKGLKGIGDWTVDIYLLHALRRTDIFPLGDLALVNAIRMATGREHTKTELLRMSRAWQPYRSMATMLFWHYYIRERDIRILH